MSRLLEAIVGLFKSRATAPEPPVQSEAREEVPTERALEELGSLLSTWGRHGFDLEEHSAEESRKRFEGWSRHVTVATAPPEGEAPPGERHWEGLRRFVAQHRQAEKGFVGQSIANLREALWSVVRNLANSLALGQSSDGELGGQIKRLRSSVTKGSTQEIKREVLEIADRMGEVLAKREEEQRTLLLQLAERARGLRDELEAARKNLATDPLTRLFNRGAFDQHLERISALNAISGQISSLAMIDVDHFKAVNDTYGHPGGDAVLRALADQIAGALPRRTDFVARYGGEEFAVILQQDSRDVARPLLDRVLRRLRTLEIPYEGETVRVTVSIGLAEWRRGEEPQDWLQRADRALYAAKQAGRDRLVDADDAPPDAT